MESLMADNIDVQGILDAMKYTRSDVLKTIQRKFSTASNTIKDEALTERRKGFFTLEEQETLRSAARILDSFKNKIEHAKEIKAREEKVRAAHLNRCKAARTKLLDQYLQQPTSMEQHREAVIFHLSLGDHASSISRGAHFGHNLKYIESDLERGLDAKYPHLNVKHVAINCQQDTYRWLEDNLWPHDAEPERSRIEKVFEIYREEWRAVTLQSVAKFLDRYDAALKEEFERDAATARAKEAVKRRADIKIIT
jgi:hypothetical protein